MMGPDLVVHVQDKVIAGWVNNLVKEDEDLDVTLSEMIMGADSDYDFNGNLSGEAL